MPKNAIIYCCNYCDFSSCKQSNYMAHLLTSKHKKDTKRYKKCQKIPHHNTCE